MERKELKEWAKQKINGHIWELLIPIIVTGILTNITIGQEITYEGGQMHVENGYTLGLFFFFVEVGLTAFMVNFINDKEHNFKDLFKYVNDYVRIFVVGLLRAIFIALWSLLLIVPGIIKAFAYALVPMILSDEEYSDLSFMEVLKKSEEMMKGHKMDYFMLNFSFVGWYLLAIPTLGLLLIWLAPYHETAATKFLYDIKTNFENQNGNSNKGGKFCTSCGTKVSDDSEFCTNCGKKI